MLPKKSNNKEEFFSQLNDYEDNLEFLKEQKALYNNPEKVSVQLLIEIKITERRIEQLQNNFRE